MTGPVLVIDTATTRAAIAVGVADAGDAGGARILAEDAWSAGYRHGEELLARIETLLERTGLEVGDLVGLVAGTGPGAFTGLRVGIATAKGLAHALGLPIVGVATSAALLDAAEGDVLLLPAGPADRVCCRPGTPAVIVPGGAEPAVMAGEHLVAVDLEGRAPAEASARGEAARAGLAGALLRLGVRRLASGDTDDLARLVPEYVTLPRGVRAGVSDDAVAVTGGGTGGR